MAEEAYHLNDFQASYQRLVDDSREPEVITKNAEQVIANAQAAIAKAQAFIQVYEQKLYCCQEKARGARGCQEADQEDLTVGPRLQSPMFSVF